MLLDNAALKVAWNSVDLNSDVVDVSIAHYLVLWNSLLFLQRTHYYDVFSATNPSLMKKNCIKNFVYLHAGGNCSCLALTK